MYFSVLGYDEENRLKQQNFLYSFLKTEAYASSKRL